MAIQPVKILQASAGSGKTFSLAAHYLTLLFEHENKYREILAVTFTNKATEEMKSRILEVLFGFATGDDARKIEDYRKIVLQAHPQLNPVLLQQQADRIYRKILHDYSRFSVSTIDGFVQKVIRGFAFELGLDSGYSLEMNTDKVKQELTKKLEKLLDERNNLLQWVVDLALDRISNNLSWNYNQELLSLVGEVFGDKFKDFEEAIGKFETEHIDQVFSNYLDFSKQSVLDFEQNIKSLAERAITIINASGFTSDDFKGKSRSPLLKFKSITTGNFADIEKVLKLIDDQDNWLQKGKDQIVLEPLNPILHQIEKDFNLGYPNYLLAKAFLKNAYFLRLMQEIAQLLAIYREESESLLISDAQKLLSGIAQDAGDNPSFIWEKMGNRYRNFLFDEFQDTSSNQWNSFKALVANAISTHNGKLHDHLIVGDAKQSIYRWRQGDYKLLHQVAKTSLGEQSVLEDMLHENYRSTAEIIDFNNDIYPKLAKELQEKVNSELASADEALQDFWNAKENAYGSIIENIYSGVAQQKHAKTAPGGIIKIKRLGLDSGNANSEEDLTPGIVQEPENMKELSLQQMLVEIQDLLDHRGYQQREIGVLVRSNAEATAAVETLMEAGLSVISGEALKIANSPAIKLIINVLKMLVASDENSALYKANVIALYAQIQHKTVNPDHYFRLKAKKIDELFEVFPEQFCLNYTRWVALPISALVEQIIVAFGLDKYLVPTIKNSSSDVVSSFNEDEKINPFLPYLFAFRDLIGSAARQGEQGISAFLNWWDEEGKAKNLPSPEGLNAIQVMTIHKSKGLAFRAVFIPFCDWKLSGKPNTTFWVPAGETPYKNLGTIPLAYSSRLKGSSISKYYLEELLMNYLDALNSLYVATTRAKDYIYISFPAKKKPSLSHVGDAIFSIFQEQFEHSDELQFGSYSQVGESLHQASLFNINSYPTSDRLEVIYTPEENRPQRYLDNINQLGVKGSNLHLLLSRINQLTDVKEQVDQLILEGLISEKEAQEYTDHVIRVLSHPELKRLLDIEGRHLNEQSIIGVDGKSYRPDKLIIGPDKLILIDYKFTAEESHHHQLQVRNYRILLQEMGYQHIEAYLFYDNLSKLKLVS